MTTTIPTPAIDTSRFEQIDGQLIQRPMPKDRHSEVQGNIIELFGPTLRTIGMRAYPELTIDEKDIPKPNWLTPDVVITKPDFARSQRNNALPGVSLVIEILSTDQNDVSDKARTFLKWGVGTVC